MDKCLASAPLRGACNHSITEAASLIQSGTQEVDVLGRAHMPSLAISRRVAKL